VHSIHVSSVLWEFPGRNGGKLPTDRPAGRHALARSVSADAVKTYMVKTTRKRALPLIIWS
jgi:hypothetical protein